MDIFGNFQEKIGKLKSDFFEYEHPAEIEPKDVLEEEGQKSSFIAFHLLVVILSLVLVLRLVSLQITQGGKFQYLAEGNRIRSRTIEAPRGLIYDRNGQILAKNVSSFSLEIYPADLPRQEEEREKVYQALKTNSSLDLDELRKKIGEKGLYSLEPIVLAENLSRDEALLLKVKYANLPGLVVEARPSREYEQVPGLAHLLGYVGKITKEDLEKNPDYKMTDRKGKSGLELVYEKNLKGKDGQEQVEVDSKGQVQRLLSSLEPEAGADLRLTLDLGLQKKMAESLQAVVERNSKAGVAIALDPQSGGVLGMVSLPSYDNNIFSQLNLEEDYQKLVDDPTKPLFNRAVSGLYPSGSTIKPFIASAALQEKVISEYTTINDPGEIRIGQWVFPDWKNHGLVDVRKAIAESCNVFFYSVGGGWDKIKGLGVNRIKKYLEKFGFGSKTGIDLPSEEAGLIPDPEWKKKTKKESWYIGDTYHLAIGQGDIGVTPLQIVTGLSAIANGNRLLRPHLLDKMIVASDEELEKYQRQIIRENFIEANNLEIVRQGMRQAVTEGSARQLADLTDKEGNPLAVAGKTGTAQFGSDNKTHAWFTVFAPYDNPQIALVVLVEEGGEGHATALPVAKEILKYWFNQ